MDAINIANLPIRVIACTAACQQKKSTELEFPQFIYRIISVVGIKSMISKFMDVNLLDLVDYQHSVCWTCTIFLPSSMINLLMLFMTVNIMVGNYKTFTEACVYISPHVYFMAKDAYEWMDLCLFILWGNLLFCCCCQAVDTSSLAFYKRDKQLKSL